MGLAGRAGPARAAGPAERAWKVKPQDWGGAGRGLRHRAGRGVLPHLGVGTNPVLEPRPGGVGAGPCGPSAARSGPPWGPAAD
eukprot:scaffold4735_cov403-Prasinococcus_capsulatus_cf.AAC.5